jgi:type IV pilus biogenesis protein CpaD/CtpE
MSRILSGRILLLTGVLFLPACGNRDPYLRDDVWKPTGANAGNLAAMVANPNDLIVGRHSVVNDTKASAIAVQHSWDGQSAGLSSGSSGGGGGQSGGASVGGPAASGS